MHKFILIVALVILQSTVLAQARKNLTGICNRDSLLTVPYKEWFEPNYSEYKPDIRLVNSLKKKVSKDITLEVFFGTWCGDSKREVPRFFKLLDAIDFPETKVRLVAVDAGEAYKQSPGAETLGKGIYRVATFIILKNGVEIGRITEHPVFSLEEDIYSILNGDNYEPNFRTYKLIDQWLERGILVNPNVSLRGLAKQLKPLLISPSELNSCAQVLVAQMKLKEAIAVSKMNSYIFYESAEAYLILSKALSKDGQHKAALENIENAIRYNKDDNELQYLLNNFYAIKVASN